jgi:UDP-N-acetylmuramoylalanine--D-glutamate ligase|tara:strand:+ start:1182 stop:1667 length:486 start_codon:yes stop_codon:yes gene_type:complete
MKIEHKISVKKKLFTKREQSLNTFSSIDHRLEFFSNSNGKIWINDSKSTDIGATAFSLENVKGPIVWIVGETQLERDLDIIYELVLLKVNEIIYYGSHETKLKYKFGSKVKYSQLSDIESAVKMASNNQSENISILFSPACSSFPTHDNYKVRGEYFKNLI